MIYTVGTIIYERNMLKLLCIQYYVVLLSAGDGFVHYFRVALRHHLAAQYFSVLLLNRILVCYG